MNRATQAIFPAIIFGSLMIIFIISLVANPSNVSAFNSSKSSSNSKTTSIDSTNCSLGSEFFSFNLPVVWI